MPTARQIREAIERLTDVQKLVHLAYRLTDPDVEELYEYLMREGRRVYTETLEQMAGQLGCPERKANLTNSYVLSELSLLYRSHATSIVATYNYNLVSALEEIYEQNKYANRHYYAKFVREWEEARIDWKGPQITLVTTQFAKNMAVQHFTAFNPITGYALFDGPDDELTCKICKELLDRNPYTLERVKYLEVPVHPNCRHNIKIIADSFPKAWCPRLWMGEKFNANLFSESLEVFDETELEGLNWLEQFAEIGITNYEDLMDAASPCCFPEYSNSD